MINKISAPNSVPTDISDYVAQNAHMMAFMNQVNMQAFILTHPTTLDKPKIAVGAYISHGGSLYKVENDDEDITGSPSNGKVYVRVTGDATLTASFVTDISSYAYNAAYGSMTSGNYTLLPYELRKSGNDWLKYRFDMIKGIADQDLRTTDSPTFANSTIAGHNINSELNTLNGRVNQGVKTTDSPTFAKLTLTTSTYGSQSVASKGSWVVPVGIYQIAEYTTDCRIEVHDGTIWYLGSAGIGAVVISDGSNVRIFNNGSSAKTVHYRKFS